MDITQLFKRGDYLLMDGMHSCAYIPRHTYRRLSRMMEKRLEQDPKTENSLRFLWSRSHDGYRLTVNPDGVELARTHGLTTDSCGRVLVPCPYLQWIYQACGREPEWCGRMRLKQLGKGPWLAMFSLE